MTKRIGILTAGSDCPGLNAAIRALGKAGQGRGIEILGFQDGFTGLLEDRAVKIEGPELSGILTLGGTMLGTSRELPERVSVDGKTEDQTDRAVAVYRKHHLEALVCIGGLETQTSALRLAEKGMNVITLPKSLNNEIYATDHSLGFDSALEAASTSIDRLHSTAHSNHRIILVEVMGRHAGWLALGSGLAGGADVILIPEIPYDIQNVTRAILARSQAGKHFSIVAVSERVVSQEHIAFTERLHRVNARLRPADEQARIAAQLSEIENQPTDTTFQVANRLKALTGLETRITILGYLLRGGGPSASDRVLATRLGTRCIEWVEGGQFGVMAAEQGEEIVPVPLNEVVGKCRQVPPSHPWLESARQVGTSFGE